MQMAASDDDLREMARHRGLKLLKSRKRTPGVGDFGKFGLSDSAGKPLLGVSDDGFTASAKDIEAYLRSHVSGSWKRSAEMVPDGAPQAPKRRSAEPDAEESVVRRRGRRPSSPRATPRPSPEPAPRPVRRQPTLRIVAEEPEPAPAQKPEPVLHIRTAKPADAGAVAGLLSGLKGVSLDEMAVARNLATVRKAKGGLILAKLDGIVGCCGWAVLPTIHRGAVGRVTLLLVERTHRRKGIGTAMFEVAEKALVEAGCAQIEVISDILIDNSHRFFRSLKFEQASYRFVRAVTE